MMTVLLSLNKLFLKCYLIEGRKRAEYFRENTHTYTHTRAHTHTQKKIMLRVLFQTWLSLQGQLAQPVFVQKKQPFCREYNNHCTVLVSCQSSRAQFLHQKVEKLVTFGSNQSRLNGPLLKCLLFPSFRVSSRKKQKKKNLKSCYYRAHILTKVKQFKSKVNAEKI